MKLKPNHFINQQGFKEVKRSNGRAYTIRNQRDRFFFPDEWLAFIDAAKKKQKVTFNTMLNTGARINEARNIKVADIDLERKNIVLRITKRVVNRPGIQKEGKRKIRVITISTKFYRYLKGVIRAYKLSHEDYIPILSTPAANIAMKKGLERAGIKDYRMFSTHNIRKTAEMWSLALDIDSFKVVKRFGHSREVALKHYLSSDIFSHEERGQIKDILGEDMYH